MHNDLWIVSGKKDRRIWIIRPVPTVMEDSTPLRQGTDFTVAWSENVNAGTATATLTGSGDYAGTVQKTFTIEKAPVTVTAADKSKISGQADPEFTATVTGKPKNGGEVMYTLSRNDISIDGAFFQDRFDKKP